MPSGFGSSWGLGGFFPNGASSSWLPGMDGPLTQLPDVSGMMANVNPGGVGGAVTSATQNLVPKLGLNFDTGKLALSGLATIGNLWAAFQANKLAKEQFNFTKNFSTANFNNQVQTYNSQLTDRANNRQIVEGRTPDYTKNYIDNNSLKRYGN